MMIVSKKKSKKILKDHKPTPISNSIKDKNVACN